MTEPQQPKKPGGFSIDIIELVVLGLGRYRWWIPLFAVIGLAVGTFMSLKIPNQFQSSGKFLVKFGSLEKQTPETVAGISDGRQFAHSLADEIQILRSNEMFEQVARELGPAYILEPPEDPTAHDGPTTPWIKRKLHEFQRWLWFGDRDPSVTATEQDEVITEEEMETPKAIAAAAAKIARTARFYAGRQTMLMGVEYKDTTPERAQEICRKLMEMCQWRHTQVFSGLLAPKYLGEQLESALREEDVMSDRFQQHTEECGFYDLPARKTQVLGEISALEEAIADDELRRKEIDQELPRIEAELAEIEPTIIETVVPQAEINPQYTLIEDQIQKKNREIENLGVSFKPGSEHYESRLAGIENAKRVLEEKLATLEPFITPPPRDRPIDNPRYVTLADEKSKLERERDRRDTGREARIERLAGKRAELQDLLDCEPIHRAMQGQIAEARSRVGQFQRAVQHNETLIAITKEKEASNLVMVHEPSFNPQKVAPERSKNVLTGLGGGLAAGLVFCVLRQFLDGKLRFPRTAKRVVGAKVLGVVPEVRSWRRAGERLRKGHAA